MEHDERVNIGHDRTEKVGHDEKITIGNNRTEKVVVTRRLRSETIGRRK